MAVYRCRTSDSHGKITLRLLEARSVDLLLRDLSVQGLYPIEVAKVEEALVESGRERKVPGKAVIDFTDSLALMLSSGISLKDAMKVLSVSVVDRKAARLASAVSEGLSKGRSFSEALDPFSRSFSPVYRSLVKIGERIGTLDEVIRRLSGYLHEDGKIRDRAVNALIYPALVLCVAVFGMILVAVVVLPKMREMFGDLGGDFSVRIDRAAGTMGIVLAVILLLLLGIASAGVSAAVLRRKGGEFAKRIDRLLFGVPVIGPYLQRRAIMNFSFAMEILTGNGIAVEDSLAEAAAGIGSVLFRDEVESVRRAVIRGERLSAAFRESGFFPSRIGIWIAVGEQTGQVEKVFSQIRTIYQGEIENWSARFMTLIEPAVILLMGGLLVGLVLTFIVPLFSMFGSLL